jgi:hypothetical protein
MYSVRDDSESEAEPDSLDQGSCAGRCGKLATDDAQPHPSTSSPQRTRSQTNVRCGPLCGIGTHDTSSASVGTSSPYDHLRVCRLAMRTPPSKRRHHCGSFVGAASAIGLVVAALCANAVAREGVRVSRARWIKGEDPRLASVILSPRSRHARSPLEPPIASCRAPNPCDASAP